MNIHKLYHKDSIIKLYHKVRNLNSVNKILIIIICLLFIFLGYTIYNGLNYNKTLSIGLGNKDFPAITLFI